MLKSHALAWRALLLAVASCTAETPETVARWENGPSMRWYAGDFHVHTAVGSNDTRSDGATESYPDVIAEVARKRGMDFVVITDHSNSAGSLVTTTTEYGGLWNQGPEFPLWDTAAALSGSEFLMIDGSEISPVSILDADQCIDCSTVGDEMRPVGHVGCFPSDLGTFVLDKPIIDRPPGAVDGGSSVDQCHDLGGLAVVNHPFPQISPWIEYDWTSFDYDAIEVWNGGVGWDVYDGYAFDAYLCDRSAGKKVVAVGGSDNHRTRIPYEDSIDIVTGPPLGLPMTSLLADSLTWPALIDAFKHGRMVMHENATFVEFRIFGPRGYLGTIGDSVARYQVNREVTVWLKGTARVAQDLQLWYVAPNSCDDKRQPHSDIPPTVDKVAVAKREVPAGLFDVKQRLTLKPGLYYASLGDVATEGINARDVAITNVFTVEE